MRAILGRIDGLGGEGEGGGGGRLDRPLHQAKSNLIPVIGYRDEVEIIAEVVRVPGGRTQAAEVQRPCCSDSPSTE